MGINYKILGQSKPASASNTTLYQVPASALAAVCSTLVICNQGTTCTYRVAVIPSGDTLSSDNYIIYDSYVNQYDSSFITIGITLSPSDYIVVYSLTGNVSFSLFGSEMLA